MLPGGPERSRGGRGAARLGSALAPSPPWARPQPGAPRGDGQDAEGEGRDSLRRISSSVPPSPSKPRAGVQLAAGPEMPSCDGRCASSSRGDPERQRPGRGAAGSRRLRQQSAAGPRSCGRLGRIAPARGLGCSRGLGSSPVTDGTGACSVPELSFGGAEGVGRGRRHKAPSPRPSSFDRPLRCELRSRPWGCPSGTGPPSRTLLKHVGGHPAGCTQIYIYTVYFLGVCVYIYVCIKARCVCCIFLAAPIPIQRFRYLCCTRMIYGLLRYIYKGTRMHTRYTVKKTCVWCFRSWRHPVLPPVLSPPAPGSCSPFPAPAGRGRDLPAAPRRFPSVSFAAFPKGFAGA